MVHYLTDITCSYYLQAWWVVEAANSRKRWKYLDHILPTNQVPYIGDYVRIVCAISNKYYTPINHTQDSEDPSLAARIMNLAAQTNTLVLLSECGGS